MTVGDRTYLHISGTPTDDLAGTSTDVHVSLNGGQNTDSWTIYVYEMFDDQPVCSFTVTSDTDPMTAIITYTGSNTSKISIDWGDGTGFQAYRGSLDDEIRHTFTTPGEHTITVEAVNANGEDSAQRVFTARFGEDVPASVVISPIGDVTVRPGETVDVDVVINPSDATMGISSPSWLHHDGHRIYGTPTEEGVYEITVIGSLGKSTAYESFTITVTADATVPGDDGDGEGGVDWIAFIACAAVLILAAAVMWYLDVRWLVILPVAGLFAAAWYFGVI